MGTEPSQQPTANPTLYPTTNPTMLPTTQPTMELVVDGPMSSGTVGSVNSLTFEFDVASLTDTLIVSTCDSTGQFNQFPITLTVGSNGQSIGIANTCPTAVNRRRLLANSTNNQSSVVINNISPGTYTATIGNLGGSLMDPSTDLWQVQVFTVTATPTSNPTEEPSEDSETGSGSDSQSESESSSGSDSSDDAFSSLFAAKLDGNMKNDTVDVIQNEGSNMDNLYVSFTHSTYVNIWAMFTVLIVLNGLCWFMCSKRNKVCNFDDESNII